MCVCGVQSRTRYGAYPSTTTWFLSAGIWPDNLHPPTTNTVHRLNSRVHIVKHTTASGATAHRIEYRAVDGMVRDDGWYAQLVKVK